ncbi:MAG: cytochrome c biogenesis protein ResB [Thermodesulfovibrionales bacterium]|nr:cytochrome c biogenesis protein ResB [Thermodesulfovibrionales bacterium]
MVKAIARFFLSLKTAFGLFLAFIVLTFAGSIALPGNLAFFSGIDETPLFKWLSASGNLGLTWWIYLMIILLAVLAVSTVFCTVESLMGKMDRRNVILRLSPQVMHIGVLLIMLGHLLTASSGFKTDVLVKKGQGMEVGEGAAVYLEDVRVFTDENGSDTDWEAVLTWVDDADGAEGRSLRPVHPLYLGKFGLYLKSVSMGPEPSALIRVCRDPGALWALIGGALLVAGGLGFIYSRFGSD